MKDLESACSQGPRHDGIAACLWAFIKTGRIPSRRAVAALAKLHGSRLERTWPYLKRAHGSALNLAFDDVLEFQYARARNFRVMVIGAYDGVENDPTANFIRRHECAGVFVEPQPAVFARLQANFPGRRAFQFVNAAVDVSSGNREFFRVRSGVSRFPAWTEQLASFDRSHIEKHEQLVPGVSAEIESFHVSTVSFADLLDRTQLTAIDVLQIDAEGCDALLLSWFPYHRLKPAVIHYEIAHMSPADLSATRSKLTGQGYRLFETESPSDEMAVLL